MKTSHFTYLMLAISATLSVFILFTSCSKEDNQQIPQANLDMAASLDATLKSGGWRVSDYTAQTPIDYDLDGDSETDLKPFLPIHLSDDIYTFEGIETSVNQGPLRIAGISDETFNRNYHVKADMIGVEFRFLSHTYETLIYRLVSFTSTEITVETDYKGVKVQTKYIKIS